MCVQKSWTSSRPSSEQTSVMSISPLSVLNLEQASSCYFPGSFAEKAGMRLRENAHLGPEERIMFEDEDASSSCGQPTCTLV
mmetsp:Transcript_14771/g.28069  ORF Transcript_14771/g.28069 Transcript_14771/m.28069 type:complete len:82 (-) Transcript_14771:3890-4135(-)